MKVGDPFKTSLSSYCNQSFDLCYTCLLDAFSELFRTSIMKLFVKIFNDRKLLTISAKDSILDDWLGFENAFMSSVFFVYLVLIPFHPKGFSWLNKINVIPEFRSAMLCFENTSISRTFVSVSKAIIERTFELANVQKKNSS